MRAPKFWQSRNAISAALLPASFLYGLAVSHRLKNAKPESPSAPVICVGNLTAGGAGKTPVALHIGARLKAKGVNAFFLSRGYGGSRRGPLLVNAQVDAASEVGDEPLLLARVLPTVVAKDRLEGARFAMAQGAQAIVMDDGLQNHALIKALSLAVIDGGLGLGNGRMLPAGPLRENPQSAFARVDAAVIVNPEGSIPHMPEAPAKLTAKVVPSEAALALRGKKVFAFCGIAYPQKFFRTLEALGAEMSGTASFPDHHPYSAAEIRKLSGKAAGLGAALVTTAKDAVRLTPALKPLATAVDISLRFDDEAALDALLDEALKQAW